MQALILAGKLYNDPKPPTMLTGLLFDPPLAGSLVALLLSSRMSGLGSGTGSGIVNCCSMAEPILGGLLLWT